MSNFVRYRWLFNLAVVAIASVAYKLFHLIVYTESKVKCPLCHITYGSKKDEKCGDKWICCDAAGCGLWWHFHCAGIKKKKPPRGKWYCPENHP